MDIMMDPGRLHDAILTGDDRTARSVTAEALAEGHQALSLINGHMIPAMDEVGRHFSAQEYFIPELLLSARAMKAALELIRPLLAAQGATPLGRVVIGTVKGDLHDIGKNIVAAMLEGGGFEVIDLGVNVSPDKFVQAVLDKAPHLVALSALLTTTMPAMKTTVEALTAAGVRERVKVLVGGAPVTEEYARQIGADGFGPNAVGAVAAARSQMAAFHA